MSILNTQNELKIVKVVNNGKTELINFNNVAKINLQYKDRIVLNFNHTIVRNITNSQGVESQGTFSGYYYIDRSTVKNYQEIHDMLFSDEFAEKFVMIESNDHCNGFVNVSEISTVKVSDHNLSIIFNLSHSVSSQRPNSKLLLSADSVISSFNDRNTFDEYVENFLNMYA